MILKKLGYKQSSTTLNKKKVKKKKCLEKVIGQVEGGWGGQCEPNGLETFLSWHIHARTVLLGIFW